jgi:hypothetical protein
MIGADEYEHKVDAARMIAELDFPSGAEHRDAMLAAFSGTLGPARGTSGLRDEEGLVRGARRGAGPPR